MGCSHMTSVVYPMHRYEEMVVKDANSKKDWSRAEQYYYQAVDVFPEGDNEARTPSSLSLPVRQITAYPTMVGAG